jgi:hypothetical protein
MKYLIVVDMQNDFITGSLGTKEAEAILPKVIEKVKYFEGTVIYTKDTHQPDYLTTQEGKNLPVEHCIERTWGWELAGELEELSKGKIVENASIGILISLVGYFIFAAVNNSFGYYSAALIIGLGNGHMFPAFQTMYINLAPHTQRGTANSSLLISWDVGVGLGILIGGVVVEYFGYNASFWVSAVVNLLGVVGFLFFARKRYLIDRLR